MYVYIGVIEAFPSRMAQTWLWSSHKTDNKKLPLPRGEGSNYGTTREKLMDGWTDRQQIFHVFKYEKPLLNFLYKKPVHMLLDLNRSWRKKRLF